MQWKWLEIQIADIDIQKGAFTNDGKSFVSLVDIDLQHTEAD